MQPRRTDGLSVRVVDGDVLVHDALHEKVHVLNASAGRVLELCDGTRSAADIARSLSASSGALLAVVTTDVVAILGEFADAGIVELTGAGSDAPVN
jgi:hypothetical protein